MKFPFMNFRAFRIKKMLMFIYNVQRREKEKDKKPGVVCAILGIALAETGLPTSSSGIHRDVSTLLGLWLHLLSSDDTWVEASGTSVIGVAQGSQWGQVKPRKWVHFSNQSAFL